MGNIYAEITVTNSLYCDKKNAFVLTRELTDAEILAGILKPKSHFGRACGKLGIEVIAANSPWKSSDRTVSILCRL
jgi:hypothetical protein